MELLGSHIPLLAALAAGAGLMMTRLGIHLGMLTTRSTSRRCPCCGVLREGRYCDRCSRRL